MNKYTSPAIEIIKFDTEDVITASIITDPDETPINK